MSSHPFNHHSTMPPDLETNHRGFEMAGSPPTWGFESYLDGEPPLEFFTTARPQEPAYFSTENGQKPRRFNIDFSKERIIFPWSAAQIQQAVDHILENCWESCKRMEEPKNYSLLWVFFDAVDLWHMGVQNAWNVLNSVYWQTRQVMPHIVAQTTVVLEQWCEKMISTDFSFRQRIFYWNKELESDPFFLLKQSQCEDLDGIDLWYLPFVSIMLMRAHSELRSGTWTARHADILATRNNEPTLSLRAEIYHIERWAFMGLANQVRFKTIGQDTFNYGNKSFQGHFMDQTLEATKSSRSHKDSGILQDQPDSDSDDVKIYTGVRASKKADMFVQKSHPFRPCPVGQVYYDMPPSIGPNSHDLYFSPRKAATGKVEEPIHAQQEPAKRLGSVHHKAAVFPTVASQQERFNLIAQMKQALINATMTEMPFRSQQTSVSMARELQQRVSSAQSASQARASHAIRAGPSSQSIHIHPRPKSKKSHLLTSKPHAAKKRPDMFLYSRDERPTTPICATKKCMNLDIRTMKDGVWRFPIQPCSCEDCFERDCTIYIAACNHGDLGSDQKRERLHMLFTNYGTVLSTKSRSNGTAAEIKFRNVHSVFAAMSMQGAIVKDICDKPLHLKHAIGSRFFQPDRKGEGLHKPVIIQHAMFLDNNNQQIVHRSHAAKLREVPYAPTRNGVFSPPPMSLSAIRAYFKPRGSGHLNNELFARRVRQNSGDTHSPLHLPPLSSRMPTRAGPSQYPMPRGPHPILDAKSNYAVSKNNGTSSVFITGDGKRLPRVMNPSWPRYPCPDPEPLPAFTFPAKKATNVQDSAQSAPLREVQNVDEGTSTVVRRPEQARPNVLHMPWMSYASSSNSDGYVADLEDAIV